MSIANALSMLAALSISPLAVQAQTTVAGVTPGSFRVTESGAAEYRIPIRVPPGIAGMEPRLTLVYNSQAANGLLGVGWNLEGLSSIMRCPRTMAQDGVRGGVNYDWNDRYCLDGQRLVKVSGASYGADGAEYRTERESFSKVISYGVSGNGPAWFKVWTKGGQILEFGNSVDSRIEAQGKTTVRIWAVSRVSDTKGNFYTVSYIKDTTNGDFRADRIDYTGNASAGITPDRSVTFAYELRPDITSSYRAGSIVKSLWRLQNAKTFVGTTLAADYRLPYLPNSPSAGTLRSRLASFTHCDSDNACLPQLAFNWNSAGQQGWQTSANFLPPYFTAADGISDIGSRFVDLNGDGLPDFLYYRYYSGNVQYGAYLNSGSGWVSAPAYTPPYFTSADGISDIGSRFVDLNGDGLPDFLYYRYYYGWVDAGAYLNTGSGWVSTPSYTPPYFISADGISDIGSRLVDLNGDGLPDFIYYRYYSGQVNAGAYLNTGSGWVSAPSYTPPYFISADGISDIGSRFVDLNGDGLPDFIYYRYYSGYVDAGAYLNTGSGWVSAPSYTAPYFISADGISDIGSRFVDLNGDGLPDFVYYRYYSGTSQSGAYLNTGTGWVSAPEYTPPYLISADGIGDMGSRFEDLNGDGLPDFLYYRYYSGYTQYGAYLNTGSGWISAPSYTPPYMIRADGIGDMGSRFEDLNGDGLPDFLYYRYYSGTAQSGAYLNSGIQDWIVSIEGGLAGTTTSTFGSIAGPTTAYVKDPSATGTIRSLQYPLTVVASVSSPNGTGGTETRTYRYGGLKAEVGTGRGLLGFRWQEAVTPSTGIKVRTEVRQDWPYAGLPSSTKTTQSSGAVLGEVVNTYSCTNPATLAACTVAAGNRYFPFVSQSIETGNDLNGAILPTVTTATQYDTFGNAQSVAVSTGDGYSKSTTNVYNNDVPNWLLGRLKSSTVLSTTPAP